MIKAKLTLHLLTNDKNLVSTVLNRAFFLPTYNNMPSEAPVPVPSAPSRNIEIKARLSGEGRFENLVKKARELTGSDGVLIEQHDVFYKVPQGRLKLRFLKDTPSQLVQYSRPDLAGAKLSEFDIIDVAQPDVLNRMLTKNLGVKGEVRKVRHLFLHEQTRIHLDDVEGLGKFLEFEVCLRPDQSIDQGTEMADEMRRVFDIRNEDLMTGAYLDHLK